MTRWQTLAFRMPAEMATALYEASDGKPAKYLRKMLSKKLGIKYEEHRPGMASASYETQMRVYELSLGKRRKKP